MLEENRIEARSLLANASEDARSKTRYSHGEEIAIDCGDYSSCYNLWLGSIMNNVITISCPLRGQKRQKMTEDRECDYHIVPLLEARTF